ncbi:tumor necrosis factor receptor superfamily member 14 isoform X2 [Latimeria chalumnae]|uniref:tumor necrosis factor receptor superfamily member 14 isoform X2 n=1 Tax=Latimeria chalumnae TaxID=7897 RepID=UPI0003C11E5E|nr:PREDICTED: tumor necrosis factor receptor superfamily member 14-like isoform X3 [Latimeria chalumnae]|eukprot:XP_005986080.1 PREDICTED: tumor necrosis factor receptor superfamily member 14-like isoform X3 [Latimeria chalumnae]
MEIKFYILPFLWIAVCGVVLKMVASCGPGEYQMENKDCCPMCSPGNVVYRHCTPKTSTTCIPCVDGTYMDHPNGLSKCLTCKICDPDKGLSGDQECTYTKNTQCSCKKGYYCGEPRSNGCGVCGKYTICKPGEKVKVEGTETMNTVCEPCPDGTFSKDEMSQTCSLWTNCDEKGEKKVKEGSSTSDVVCEKESSKVVIVVVVSVLVLVLVAAGIGVLIYLAWKQGILQKYCGKKPGERASPEEIQPCNHIKDGHNGGLQSLPIQETKKELSVFNKILCRMKLELQR